jgi:hypothetical protein
LISHYAYAGSGDEPPSRQTGPPASIKPPRAELNQLQNMLRHENSPNQGTLTNANAGRHDGVFLRTWWGGASPQFTVAHHKLASRRFLLAMSSPGTPCKPRRELRAIVFRRRPIHCRSVGGRSNGSQFRRPIRPAGCIGQCRGCAQSLPCLLVVAPPTPHLFGAAKHLSVSATLRFKEGPAEAGPIGTAR